MSSNSSTDIDALIAAIMENAAACIRGGALLEAIDWAKVDGADVAAMLERLAGDGVALPARLARALLIAGHDLPAAEHREKLPPALRVLEQINRMDDSDGESVAGEMQLAETINGLAALPTVDGGIAVALVKALKCKGFARFGVRLALAHWLRAPEALRFVSGPLTDYVSTLPAKRLRLLGFSTSHMLAQDLVPAMAALGLGARIDEAGFDQVLPELLRAPDGDYDAYLLALDLDGFYQPDWRAGRDDVARLLDDKLDALVGALARFAERAGSPILLNTCPTTAAPATGHIDCQDEAGRARAIARINQRLAEVARQNTRITLIDADVAMAGVAPDERSDPKLWFYGRLPFSAPATRALALGFARALEARATGPAKVLALDLDGTLWGGLIGEEGIAGLACGDDFPGNAFKAFQNECLRLKSQGMLLAILSKNDSGAIAAFAEHPGMALRDSDFVATRINWKPKPDNIRELAGELDLGLASFIFLDDSPHEREAMRRLCPEVLVPELPDDPARRPDWLRGLAATWPTRLTSEDARRSDMYAAVRKAGELRASVASFEDYLAGLGQKLVIAPASPRTRPRIAQMHARTNQFNLTVARYDEARIEAMMADEERYGVFVGRVVDKFGDHGLVITATVHIDGDRADILSFLMSCRVIGREIERAFLGELLGYLADRGVERVEGAYVASERNAIVRDFFAQSGFDSFGQDGEKALWAWDSTGAPAPASDHVEVEWRGDAT